MAYTIIIVMLLFNPLVTLLIYSQSPGWLETVIALYVAENLSVLVLIFLPQ